MRRSWLCRGLADRATERATDQFRDPGTPLASAHRKTLANSQGHDGNRPLSIRDLARRVQRDVKAVHADVTALVKAGIVEKTTTGKIHFPYDAIHVDFIMKAAA